MDLKLKDVAELLSVSEAAIRKWLTEGKIPAYRLDDEYRFSRTEIENWMINHDTSLEERQIYPEEESSNHKKGWQQFSLFRAIHKGIVLERTKAKDKESLICDVMQHIAPLLMADAEGMSEMLIERELLMPTSIGFGIAVPHTRDFLTKGSLDMVCPVFLEEPLEWGALDKEPVHALFFFFASDDKKHLNLLAKLAHLCSEPASRAFLKSRPTKAALLDYIKKWESA
jgi:PTS system nitrogen regulatory IIA component